jgi:hypothetical protein
MDRSPQRPCRGGAGRALTRDPAAWAWLLVALLALLPLRAVLTAPPTPATAEPPSVQAPAPSPVAERPPPAAHG